MCRPLTEAAFVRLILTQMGLDPDDREPLPYTLAYAFDRLEADTEHPEEARAEARTQLAAALGADRPTLCFARTLAAVRAWQNKEELRDVVGYAALPELIEDGSETGKVEGYHEIHAHLRGSVPWPCLWVGWLCDERWRGRQRKCLSKHDGWERTHAELIERAGALRRWIRPRVLASFGGRPAGVRHAMLEEMWWSRLAARVAAEGQEPPANTISASALDQAATYLAILAHLRRASLFRRGSAGGEIGLAPFVRSYDRYSRSQKRGRNEAAERRARVGQILDRFQRDGAVAVELRPTFERTPGALRRRLLDLVEGYLQWLAASPNNQIALGLVPSLFKQESFPSGDGTALDALGEVEAAAQRSERWEAQVTALTEILEDEPILRWFVVGLDAAGAERGCPVRAFAPAIAVLDRYHRRHGVAGRWPGVQLPLDALRERARRFDAEGIDVLRDLWPGWPRLGKTNHAGEDFVDPLTGLRHIDEALTFLGHGPGDRIGHAIAISLDPPAVRELLARRARSPERTGVMSLSGERWLLRVPRGEHLLDLAWAAERLGADGDLSRAALAETSTRTWLGAQAVIHAGLSLADPRPALAGLHYGPGQIPRAQVVEEVEIGPVHLEIREELRKRVLARLVTSRATIESCPTSNLAVANLEVPPIQRLLEVSGLLVALATDDPALFECFPAREVGRWCGEQYRIEVAKFTEQASWVRAS